MQAILANPVVRGILVEAAKAAALAVVNAGFRQLKKK